MFVRLFGYLVLKSSIVWCVRLVGVISLRLSASYCFYPYLSYFASYILLSILIHLHGMKKLGGDLSLKLNIVLSSNTKKGEIERTFPSLLRFDVCRQHNKHSNKCASVADNILAHYFGVVGVD